MQTVAVGSLRVSRFILGGNPFSAISHQGEHVDRRMARHFTVQRIKDTLRQAEGLGVNSFIGRADNHIIRVLLEYWEEGGAIQWLAQTCPEYGSLETSLDKAIYNGAKGCHIHGGIMDHLLHQRQLDDLPKAIATIRSGGLAAGITGHNPEVFRWAEKHLDVDYYMCSYYNPSHRDERPGHDPNAAEWFLEEDRKTMTDLIQGLSRPVIHYKVLAAGRNDPKDGLRFAAGRMRPQDAVCVGVCGMDRPAMLEEDVELLARFGQVRAGSGFGTGGESTAQPC